MYESSNLECFLFLHCLHFAACKQWLFIHDLHLPLNYIELVSDFRNFFGVRCSIGRDIANITVLRILYSDCLLRSTSLWLMRLPESIVYITLCNSPGLQRVHISVKQIFHVPLHPSNKKFYLPDSGRHVTSVHQSLSQAGAGEEPGYEVDVIVSKIQDHVTLNRHSTCHSCIGAYT